MFETFVESMFEMFVESRFEMFVESTFEMFVESTFEMFVESMAKEPRQTQIRSDQRSEKFAHALHPDLLR
jgi:hypothetical protein